MTKLQKSSFRDPSGFLFYSNDVLYRQINSIYQKDYEQLINSGLYETLINDELLIAHKEVNEDFEDPIKGYKVIKPDLIDFISYPYEWCFSQLKNAALLTLKIQKTALNFGMSLKDCSAYNVQFRNANPIFIDTLSFEKQEEGQPWVAYRQFCQHFLAPLALMSKKDIRLNQLFRIYIDGIPLDLASSLLPLRSRFKASLFFHIHLHSKSQKRFANKSPVKRFKIKPSGLLRLIESLEKAIINIKWHPRHSEWSNYYEDTNYSSDAIHHKKEIISECIEKISPKIIWDIGANVGLFSRIASNKGIKTIAFDNDPVAVERNYIECITKKETHLLPLLLDFTNPSAGLGWENQEKLPWIERRNADTVFALALIHHIAISNNVPFRKIAKFFSDLCSYLIIEFIPKNDTNVQRLLTTRKDIFSDYSQTIFEREFKNFFKIKECHKITDSLRVLYFMQKRDI